MVGILVGGAGVGGCSAYGYGGEEEPSSGVDAFGGYPGALLIGLEICCFGECGDSGIDGVGAEEAAHLCGGAVGNVDEIRAGEGELLDVPGAGFGLFGGEGGDGADGCGGDDLLIGGELGEEGGGAGKWYGEFGSRGALPHGK